MSKRMLRSVLGAAVAAVALALGTAGAATPGDVAWGSDQVGTQSVSTVAGADDVAWGVAPVTGGGGE
ncbi:hypothetical protein ACFYWS_31680 [Streptomyces sp. NPDC002795]|uniref:hypothetical protein n=1 Tax=Streptomyces sp. NPDC002795 TaxID=3364665 RepID=UPI0036CFADD7